jgi:hypothetical protein
MWLDSGRGGAYKHGRDKEKTKELSEEPPKNVYAAQLGDSVGDDDCNGDLLGFLGEYV